MANLDKGCLWFTHDALKSTYFSIPPVDKFRTTSLLNTFKKFENQLSTFLHNDFSISFAEEQGSPIRRSGHQMVGHHDVHMKRNKRNETRILGTLKKITHSVSKTPIYGELYRDFPQRLCTCVIPSNAEDTILAGRSAASPKESYGSL